MMMRNFYFILSVNYMGTGNNNKGLENVGEKS